MSPSKYVIVPRKLLEDIREHRHDADGVGKAIGLILNAEVSQVLLRDVELDKHCQDLAKMLSMLTGQKITATELINSVIDAYAKLMPTRTWRSSFDADR